MKDQTQTNIYPITTEGHLQNESSTDLMQLNQIAYHMGFPIEVFTEKDNKWDKTWLWRDMDNKAIGSHGWYIHGYEEYAPESFLVRSRL